MNLEDAEKKIAELQITVEWLHKTLQEFIGHYNTSMGITKKNVEEIYQ